MKRQVAQRSVNCGWGYGETSVANDAKVNVKGDSHGSEEKSSKEKSSKEKSSKEEVVFSNGDWKQSPLFLVGLVLFNVHSLRHHRRTCIA